ncbi:hypothetical protein ACG2F4_11730 [Halalkalibaculum sp. DA3122]|uniref:hypothetical protein n=1 Tax=unclassified Halalkalibaculum TaxID=2964617 RepID=UPI003754CEE1
MRIIFLVILFLHGLIHLMGFVKAFQLAEIEQLTLPISQSSGLLWLFTCILMLSSGVAYLLKTEWWWIITLLAVAISQVLIFMYWQDAKAGTLANLLILIFIWISRY